MGRYSAVEVIETVCGAGKFTGDGGAEYPCVRRLRHRRLITFLWLQGLQAPTELITRETFFSVKELRLLVERGQWSDAVDHLSRFLPPPDTPLSLSVEAAVLHRFLVVHMALADVVAGAKFSYHLATLNREYFSRDRAVCQGTIRLRSVIRSIVVNTRHQDRASIDWECVRRRAAEIVYDLAFQTPELRQVALMPGGPMKPHNVLPIWSGFHRSSHVKKQACRRRPRAFALALAKLYLQKRSSLPSLSQESPDDLLNKTLNWVADILDESFRAGKRQENPLQINGKEGSSCNPISQITFGTSTDHASDSLASSLRGKDAASALILKTNMFGGLAGPATNHGMSSVANAGELASHVPTAGAPFLGTAGAPASKTEFGSLISHFENSEVTLMANAGAPYRPLSKSMFATYHATNSVNSSARGAGATASPVSQTAFGSFTGPTITPGRPSVASAGKLSTNVPTPGTPFLGTRGAPVSQSLFGSLSSHCGSSYVASVANAGTSASCTLTSDCISSTPENSGVQLVTNAGAHVAAVTQTMNLASHSQNSGITEHLDQEGYNAESGFNPKKHPREELTTSDEQDLRPKRQRTTGAFGKQSLTPKAVET